MRRARLAVCLGLLAALGTACAAQRLPIPGPAGPYAGVEWRVRSDGSVVAERRKRDAGRGGFNLGAPIFSSFRFSGLGHCRFHFCFH